MIGENEIKRLIKGDHLAFKELFDYYSTSLYQFSFHYLKSREESEDVIQEVFLKIWKSRESIKSGTSFRSYLFTIALNSIRKKFNKLSRLNEVKHEILFDLSEDKTGFDDFAAYQDLLLKLEELIEMMPEKRKQVFQKKKNEGKSLMAISEELGISVKTVEYHLTEAMKFLKKEFQKLHIKGIIFFYLFVWQK